MTAFESGEPHQELPCSITPDKPILDLDLTFHSGYLITLPVQELIGRDQVVVLFRVISETTPGRPVYFEDRLNVPAIADNARGAVAIPGQFASGEGTYHVDLLVRDSADRFCTSSWDLTATPPAKGKRVSLALSSGEIAASGKRFQSEATIAKSEEATLSIKVLANFVPRTKSAGAIAEADEDALVSILRGISRNPKVGSISLVAFNLYEERIVFRQTSASKLDFPGLGKALETLNPGTVALDQLSNKNSSVDFLADLVSTELAESETARPDAVIFIGPKAFVDGRLDLDKLAQARASAPVFYFNYVSNPQDTPWRDTLGHMVKLLRGLEFTVTGPRDLWNALSDVVSRTADLRGSVRPAAH